MVSTGQGLLGNNMFAYCGNNPICRTDSSGESWFVALIVIGVCALTLSGCSAPEIRDTPDLDIDIAPVTSYNCFGNGIMKEVVANPPGYTRGDSVQKTYDAVVSVVGDDNIRLLTGIDDVVYDNECKVALRCGQTDYHFIRETENGWYNKSGTYGGLYVSEEYVLGDEWYAQGYHPYTGNFVEDKNTCYTGRIIYYALRVDWDEN